MNAHTDMSSVIIPKSDQWNADDFIAGPITFTIADVKIAPGTEQPVNILLEGTEKFFRPCKSMSRVLVGAWGPDAKAYIGRSLTLYRDPEVKWGGMAVGGIRISHLSDIDGAKVMVLTATKGSRKPHKVMPLVIENAPKQDDGAARWANAYIAKLPSLNTPTDLGAFVDSKAAKLAELQGARPELHARVVAATNARAAALTPATGFDDDDLGDVPAKQPETILEHLDAEEETPDPRIATADRIIAEIEQQGAEMDINTILSRNTDAIAAMPVELESRIAKVVTAQRAKIKAKHEAEKAREAAE